MILGPPSIGRPLPSRILPRRSLETGSLTVSSRNLTLVVETSKPDVPSKTCTTARSDRASRTCPLLSSPVGVRIRTSSPYPTFRTFCTNNSGPEIWLTVEYSRTTTDIYAPSTWQLQPFLLTRFGFVLPSCFQDRSRMRRMCLMDGSSRERSHLSLEFLVLFAVILLCQRSASFFRRISL